MDKRPYVQRNRAVSSEATRRRVLDAARATLERGPVGALRVDEVARTADVSRSTVYVLYGSRSGLFDALGRFLRDEAGFEELMAASMLPDAIDNLRMSQRAAVRMYAKMPELARALFTLAAIDPDAVAAVTAIEDGRRPGMARLAQALSAQGYLRDDITIDEASEILSVITSFQSFDELFAGSGLPADTVADRLIAMAERSVCRPDLEAVRAAAGGGTGTPVRSRRRPGTPPREGGHSPA
jgi:AcrR family transcriptional regulator